jgi:hypothetical protein
MFYLNLLEDPKKPKSNFVAIFLFVALICLAAWLFSGCITQKACNERYPTKDSIYTIEKVICVPDTLYTPAETVYMQDEIPCPPTAEYHKTTHRGGITESVTISKGKISVICHEDSLKRIVEDQVRTITTYQSKKAEIIKVTVEKPFPWWVTFLMWWFVGTLVMTIAYLLFLYFRTVG